MTAPGATRGRRALALAGPVCALVLLSPSNASPTSARLDGLPALVLWAYTDNAYRPFYDKLGGEVVADGLDEGVADVAYGWRELSTLQVSVTPTESVRAMP